MALPLPPNAGAIYIPPCGGRDRDLFPLVTYGQSYGASRATPSLRNSPDQVPCFPLALASQSSRLREPLPPPQMRSVSEHARWGNHPIHR